MILLTESVSIDSTLRHSAVLCVSLRCFSYNQGEFYIGLRKTQSDAEGPRVLQRVPAHKETTQNKDAERLFCFSLTYSYNPIALCRLIYNLPNLGQLALMFKLNGKGVNSWLFV